MSRGVYVRGVSVQEGICPGVSVRGVHVQGGYVLEPYDCTYDSTFECTILFYELQFSF